MRTNKVVSHQTTIKLFLFFLNWTLLHPEIEKDNQGKFRALKR